jgi:uncharacterized membrane protein required for colicin V production
MAASNITSYAVTFVIALILVPVISYFFWRWIFAVKRQLWNQKQQINLLLKIAEKLGVDMQDNEVKTIRYHNNDTDDSSLK